MQTNHLGYFISIEGVDGSGKSTILEAVKNRLLENKLYNKFSSLFITREPGGTKNNLAEHLRTLIVNKNQDYEVDAETEAMLLATSRINHVNFTLLPHLEKNALVIADRYVDSSYVYQGIGRRIGINKIYEINKLSTDKCVPDLTIILMLDPEIAMQRIDNSQRQKNRLDTEDISFYQDIYRGYRNLKDWFPERNYKYVDVNCSKEEAIEKVHHIIELELKKAFQA